MVFQSEYQESEWETRDPVPHQISILFVDDEPGILEAVRIFLEDTSTCTVDTAESASVALEKLHEHLYDIIIADYVMPDIDGITFLQIFREQYGDIPFILYTGVDREEVLIEAINKGVNFYLQKGGDPVTEFTELLHIIEQAVLRKRAEQALRESERRYRSIIENSIDVYYRIDKQKNLILVSPSVQTLLGYDPVKEVIGNPYTVFWNDTQKREEILALIRSQGMIRDYEVPLPKKNGDTIPVSVSCSYYYDERGDPAGFEGIIRDISERKRAEEELKKQQQILNQSHAALRQANKQLNLLSSITRHDILNKITILNGFLSVIREESKDPGIIEYLDILESTTRMIQHQIAFTRVYQDLGTQEPQWIPINTLISSLSIPDTIRFSRDTDQIEIYTDPISGKVFENLLDNTIRHGQKVTTVTITATPAPEGLYIIWEDDGTGIAASEKERIFERGYGENTGLGLYLVREILSITGIRIRENGTEGVGARFEIHVPEGGFRVKGLPGTGSSEE